MVAFLNVQAQFLDFLGSNNVTEQMGLRVGLVPECPQSNNAVCWHVNTCCCFIVLFVGLRVFLINTGVELGFAVRWH